jgi:hypothetical protein
MKNSWNLRPVAQLLPLPLTRGVVMQCSKVKMRMWKRMKILGNAIDAILQMLRPGHGARHVKGGSGRVVLLTLKVSNVPIMWRWIDARHKCPR